MPIEIRELVIRATVGTGGAAGCRPPAAGDSRPSSRTRTPSDDDVVETCVREVLRILEAKQER